jgi:hypothetical protein
VHSLKTRTGLWDLRSRTARALALNHRSSYRKGFFSWFHPQVATIRSAGDSFGILCLAQSDRRRCSSWVCPSTEIDKWERIGWTDAATKRALLQLVDADVSGAKSPSFSASKLVNVVFPGPCGSTRSSYWRGISSLLHKAQAWRSAKVN